MNKISRSISDIKSLDDMASRDIDINNIHPLAKLCVIISYIIVVVSFYKYSYISDMMSMIIFPIAMFIFGGLSIKEALYKLRIVLPLMCIVGIFNPFFDKNMIQIGTYMISGGILSMIILIIKCIFTIFASYILIATTSIEKICYAMRLIHIPDIFVTQILLIYRYITVLLVEIRKIIQSYELRAPGQKGINIKVWGSLVGQVLLRSMDRADMIYQSMQLRGYKGEFYIKGKIRWKISDTLFLLWIVIFIILRNYPIFRIVGGSIVR